MFSGLFPEGVKVGRGIGAATKEKDCDLQPLTNIPCNVILYQPPSRFWSYPNSFFKIHKLYYGWLIQILVEWEFWGRKQPQFSRMVEIHLLDKRPRVLLMYFFSWISSSRPENPLTWSWTNIPRNSDHIWNSFSVEWGRNLPVQQDGFPIQQRNGQSFEDVVNIPCWPPICSHQNFILLQTFSHEIWIFPFQIWRHSSCVSVIAQDHPLWPRWSVEANQLTSH